MDKLLDFLYPGSSLSVFLELGETEIRNRFAIIKAHIRERLDGSAVPELQNIQAQVKLMAELENAVLTRLGSNRSRQPMQ